jgi:hypothetical protein
MASSSYPLRSKDVKKQVAAPLSVPSGFTRLDAFNSDQNKNSKYPGIKGKLTAAVEKGIYVREFKVGTNKFGDKCVILLWWEKPAYQIDNFLYTGKPADDIRDCDVQLGYSGKQALNLTCQHTWHHTGEPAQQSCGTMQLVPTDEHEALSHLGGSSISTGKYGDYED